MLLHATKTYEVRIHARTAPATIATATPHLFPLCIDRQHQGQAPNTMDSNNVKTNATRNTTTHAPRTTGRNIMHSANSTQPLDHALRTHSMVFQNSNLTSPSHEVVYPMSTEG